MIICITFYLDKILLNNEITNLVNNFTFSLVQIIINEPPSVTINFCCCCCFNHSGNLLPELLTVNLDNNNVEQLTVGMFTNLTKVTWLSFNSNPIKYIEPGTFDDVTSLTHLFFLGANIPAASLYSGLLASMPLVSIQISATSFPEPYIRNVSGKH